MPTFETRSYSNGFLECNLQSHIVQAIVGPLKGTHNQPRSSWVQCSKVTHCCRKISNWSNDLKICHCIWNLGVQGHELIRQLDSCLIMKPCCNIFQWRLHPWKLHVSDYLSCISGHLSRLSGRLSRHQPCNGKSRRSNILCNCCAVVKLLVLTLAHFGDEANMPWPKCGRHKLWEVPLEQAQTWSFSLGLIPIFLLSG